MTAAPVAWRARQTTCAVIFRAQTVKTVTFLDDRLYNNSSGDEIANVNFYAVRLEAIPEFAEITQK